MVELCERKANGMFQYIGFNPLFDIRAGRALADWPDVDGGGFLNPVTVHERVRVRWRPGSVHRA